MNAYFLIIANSMYTHCDRYKMSDPRNEQMYSNTALINNQYFKDILRCTQLSQTICENYSNNKTNTQDSGKLFIVGEFFNNIFNPFFEFFLNCY